MDFGYKRKSSKRREAALLSLLREVGIWMLKHADWSQDGKTRFFPLMQKLSGLETEEDLREYPPHLYADEGDSGTVSELDSISIPGEDSVEEATKDLGPNFKQLAVICKPPHTQNDAYQTWFVLERWNKWDILENHIWAAVDESEDDLSIPRHLTSLE